ncbi:woronin body major protein [Cordyceps militaris CM01]|uniref:Woronin body major protein n=1 Tax=Cordyceps militaris (strain CM01) TaxID=983644 RepID=G3JA53_CORMM|nr:woronin body major protein [Cordyceps militaris CM01]EGX95073.1 woronin body major protein [Cordyceps militaris CM01]
MQICSTYQQGKCQVARAGAFGGPEALPVECCHQAIPVWLKASQGYSPKQRQVVVSSPNPRLPGPQKPSLCCIRQAAILPFQSLLPRHSISRKKSLYRGPFSSLFFPLLRLLFPRQKPEDFLSSFRALANLDFEARVPVPFSIFPSTYRDSESQTTTQTHEEIAINLPANLAAGREGQYSSHKVNEEEVRFTREEDLRRRPGYQSEQQYVKEDRRPAHSEYADTHIEVDTHRQSYGSPIDNIEREYRERYRPRYTTTVDAAPQTQTFQSENIRVDEYTVNAGARPSSVHREDIKITEETFEPFRYGRADQKSKMGYYDEDGHYHSFRHGMHKLADRVVHPRGHHEDHIDVEVREGPAPRGRSSEASQYLPNTVTIPCHHIRIGDFLMLQGRPCQVIRVSTSSATGQYRYLGVDLFTRQLHEESSFVSNPAPSVVVQTMLGPVFKQYRVLDLQGGNIVAMTETGDVKQNLAVIDQSNLWSRLSTAFESGRGSVRALVLNDNGRELAVDMKVIHGSRL